MAIIGIIAIAKNYAIGRGGKLPWHYSADLKFFKQTTSGNVVVMGLNTWKSIGKPLPNRLNIVLSRNENIDPQPNVILMRSTDEVIALSEYLNCDLFIIGGAKTFENFAALIEKWIVTEVPLDVEDADTFMPRDFLDGFELAETKDIGEDLNVKILHRN
ncbi:MAG TPA: dihydrofolate reductase [Pyrinomonadaceae bacterium]|jgi:dihydrofolate reductase|nr:dihydrofolate reductase [Pyrinomonadaceae bacterium]